MDAARISTHAIRIRRSVTRNQATNRWIVSHTVYATLYNEYFVNRKDADRLTFHSDAELLISVTCQTTYLKAPC